MSHVTQSSKVIGCVRLTRYAVRYNTIIIRSYGCRKKNEDGVFPGTESTSPAQRKEFELILTVKMEASRKESVL